MPDILAEDVSNREKIRAIIAAAKFRPRFTVLLVLLGIVVAILEGIGLTFIVPIIEIVQADEPEAEADGVMMAFITVYNFVGLPLTLGFVIAGVAVVMTVRYTSDFFYSWFRRLLRYHYQRHLQKQTFDRSLHSQMHYFDRTGSDTILNTIITESAMAAGVINQLIKLLNLVLLSLVYLVIAFWISPLLTLLTVAALGGITIFLRHIVNPGYRLGDRVADANVARHEYAQAGIIGIRDIRIFNLQNETYRRFVDAVDSYTANIVKLKRNESAIDKFYNLSVSLFVFILVYVALGFANLSFGELGLFLFLMFQLGPKMSAINERFYTIENELPHLVRTQRFIAHLDAMQEPRDGTRAVPESIDDVEFDSVTFSYEESARIIDHVSFQVKKGEFVGFVGPSGAGKSTIVSLLARFYEPDSGRITANEWSIDTFHPNEWRDRLAIVRQNPFLFNDTLRYNLTIGNRTATQEAIDRACQIAKVDEFIDELPHGYDSRLGDDGVQLSGGQKQRVALARALLKDADILILDEATSDLDSHLERDVQQGIEAMEREYLVIAIAHRLSTVENADTIYSMQDGKIVERGSHEELVVANGTYANLYSIQSN